MTRTTETAAELLDSKKKMLSGTYLRNAWYVAAWSDDLAEGQLLGRTILKEPIVLFRKADGNVAALEDRCPHRFAPLHMGKIVGGDRVQCPYHGLEFDASGACVRNPHGTKSIPPRARVRSYPVTEKHKAIWIWMGSERADEQKGRTSACSTMCRKCTRPSVTTSPFGPITSSSLITCSI